eukprot:PhF_6_TR34963/c2_g3_i4/m.50759
MHCGICRAHVSSESSPATCTWCIIKHRTVPDVHPSPTPSLEGSGSQTAPDAYDDKACIEFHKLRNAREKLKKLTKTLDAVKSRNQSEVENMVFIESPCSHQTTSAPVGRTKWWLKQLHLYIPIDIEGNDAFIGRERLRIPLTLTKASMKAELQEKDTITAGLSLLAKFVRGVGTIQSFSFPYPIVFTGARCFLLEERKHKEIVQHELSADEFKGISLLNKNILSLCAQNKKINPSAFTVDLVDQAEFSANQAFPYVFAAEFCLVLFQ